MSHNGHGSTDLDYLSFMMDVLITLVNIFIAVGVVTFTKELFFSKR